jgi:hypothetical protein
LEIQERKKLLEKNKEIKIKMEIDQKEKQSFVFLIGKEKQKNGEKSRRK